jgi:hypothetical protein
VNDYLVSYKQNQIAPPYIDFDFDHNILWIADWSFSSSKSLKPQPIVERGGKGLKIHYIIVLIGLKVL